MLYMNKSTYLYFDRAEQNEIKQHKNNDKTPIDSRLLGLVGLFVSVLIVKPRFMCVGLTLPLDGFANRRLSSNRHFS